ncbi:MAG: response regulator [Cyanobacteriota/Melainabacteria group bacterium]
MDKDEDFLKVVEELGRESAVEVVRAQTAPEALDKAAQYPLDAALINIVTEKSQEGFKLAMEIRSLPGNHNLPLAFISGADGMQDETEGTHAGASLYLNKPFKPDSLEKAVEHLVAIRQGGRPRILITDDDEFFANTIALVLRNEGMIVKTLNDPPRFSIPCRSFRRICFCSM